MTFKTIVVTPASVEPMTSDEANQQLKIDDGFDDDHRDKLISIARDKAEKFCNRFFTEQVVKIVFDGAMCATKIDLPFPDLQSVDSITYIDADNAVQTIAAFDYTLFPDEQVIYPSSSFPTSGKSYTVTVTTGVPAEYGGAKIGMLMMLTDLYELRTESVVGFSVNDNPAVVASLYPYRVNLGV